MAESAAVGRGISPYKRLRIYSTRSRLLVVGYDEAAGRCRVLRLNRQDAQQLEATEDAESYTPEEANAVLMQMQEATAQQGGLQLVCEGHGIIGCFRFTDSYYLLVITRREYVGHICGHKVYKIAETAIIPLSAAMQRLDNSSADSTAEKRYRKLLAAVDLTKDFFFSYSYSLAHTLQRNHTGAAPTAPPPSASAAASTAAGAAAAAAAAAGSAASKASPARPRAATPPPPAATAAAAAADTSRASSSSSQPSSSGSHPDIFDSMFVWNAFLTRALRAAAGSSRWAVPLVHGFWEQRAMSVFGRPLTVTVVARRSRHFAGTRFRKRGINDEGKVANEVETEQIVDAGVDWATGQPLWSSVVQLRGSIPLYWSQQASTLSPKPDIVLQQFDPLYRVTQRHFDDLRSRYGNPVVALNLLKARERRPREALLRKEFAAAISMLNDAVADPGRKIAYIPWDFQQWAKQPGANILLEISSVMRLSLDLTGVYVHNPAFCDSCAPSVHHRRTQFAQRLAENASARPQRRTRHFKKQQQQHQHDHHHQQQQHHQRQQQHASGAASSCGAASSSGAASSLPPHSSASAASQPTSAPAPTATPTAGIPLPLPLPLPKSARSTAPRTQLQHGVLRTNCIDCLDRTNVAQFAFGLMALGRQLHELGLLDGPDIDSDSSAALHLMEMYELMGHELALQYGGSEAHSVFFQRRRGEWEAATQSRDLITSIRRFYSNTYTDSEKQDAINLFLGNYVPGSGKPALWELDSDYYLHSGPWALYGELMAARQLQAVSPLSSSRQASPFRPEHHERHSTTNGTTTSDHSSSRGAVHVRGASAGSDASASSSGGHAAKATPFASPGAQVAASAAMGPAMGPVGFVAREGNPLLPLTHSDGVTIDAPDSSPSSAEGGWDFRLVFQLRAAQAGPLQLFPSSTPGCQLLSLDRILAKQPRVRNVRLYPSASTRSNMMWDAVQQAFTFFATANDGAGSVGAIRTYGSDASWQSGTPPGSPNLWPTTRTSTAPATPAAITAAAQPQPPPSTTPAAISTTQAALGPAPAASAPATATGLLPSMPDQLLSALGSMRPGGRAPASSPIPVLNDFLEIRTDIAPVRRITKTPPPTYGVSANRWLDSALEQLAWASLPSSRPGSRPPISALNDIIEIRPAAAAATTATAVAAAGAGSGTAVPAEGFLRGGDANRSAVQPGGTSTLAAAGADASVSGRGQAIQIDGDLCADAGVAANAQHKLAGEVSTSDALWSLPNEEEADWVVVAASSAADSGASPLQHPQTLTGWGQHEQLSQQGRGVSSGDMAEPSLTQWLHADARSLGLVPEVAAVWVGGEGLHEAWAAAQERVGVGYKWYVSPASTWQLMEPKGCAALQRWYEQHLQGGSAGGHAAPMRAL